MLIAPEEELIRLLKFSTSRKIREFINRNPSMDLHYPNKILSTPLTTAIDRSDPIILSMVIDKISGNLDATLTQPCGRTALMYASCYAKNPNVLHILIKKGADPDKKDINGWNCLYYAVIGKRLQNVIALLDAEVSIEMKDNQGRTPLMISVYLSNFEIFNYLISRGADINAIDKNGLSVLHVAILRRRRDYVIELLNRNSIDRPTPSTKISTQRLLEELMCDMLPVKKSYYDEEIDVDDYQ